MPGTPGGPRAPAPTLNLFFVLSVINTDLAGFRPRQPTATPATMQRTPAHARARVLSFVMPVNLQATAGAKKRSISRHDYPPVSPAITKPAAQ